MPCTKNIHEQLSYASNGSRKHQAFRQNKVAPRSCLLLNALNALQESNDPYLLCARIFAIPVSTEITTSEDQCCNISQSIVTMPKPGYRTKLEYQTRSSQKVGRTRDMNRRTKNHLIFQFHYFQESF